MLRIMELPKENGVAKERINVGRQPGSVHCGLPKHICPS